MIERVGIAGAGKMGRGIAQRTAQAGAHVILYDFSPEALDAGLAGIRATLAQAVGREIFSSGEARDIRRRIIGSNDIEDLAEAGLVIEAIPENAELKAKLFAVLDRVCPDRAVFATNTSSLSVSELARASGRPERFIGLHYFYHAAKNRLVEIAPGEETSVQTLEFVRDFAHECSLTPIITRDTPGFAVNRFFVPWYNEAARIADETGIATVEAAACRAFGIALGPFALMNATGIAVAHHVATTLGKRLGAFYAPAKSLVRQFERGEDWEIIGEIDEEQFDAVGGRLWGLVFAVTDRIIAEGIVAREDLDLAARTGLRWPLGPCGMADEIGPDEVRDLVRMFSDVV